MGDGYQEVQEVISIHAPTRGATIIFQMSLSRTLFQSTLPREERHVLDIYIYDMCIFQSTLPREERRKKQSYNVRNRQFQSTLPREERPQHYLIFKPYARISIHAPTRGATIVAIS